MGLRYAIGDFVLSDRPISGRPAASGPAVSGVLLGDLEDWTSGLPLDVAVKRIDLKGSNPY
jgi:hypothetical protein